MKKWLFEEQAEIEEKMESGVCECESACLVRMVPMRMEDGVEGLFLYDCDQIVYVLECYLFVSVRQRHDLAANGHSFGFYSPNANKLSLNSKSRRERSLNQSRDRGCQGHSKEKPGGAPIRFPVPSPWRFPYSCWTLEGRVVCGLSHTSARRQTEVSHCCWKASPRRRFMGADRQRSEALK